MNPEYLIHRFGENPENVYEEYLRLIRQCIEMPESFRKRQRNRKQSVKNGKRSQKNLRLPMAQEENEEARIVVVEEELSEIEKGKQYRRFRRLLSRGDETGSRMPLTRLLIIMGWNGMEIFP